MAHRLDIVAVGVVDKRAVVRRMIFLANAGLAVVASASTERRLVKCVDSLVIGRRERDVDRRTLAFRNPEVGLAFLAEAGRFPEFHHQLISERRERLLIKLLALRVVRHLQTDMVEHSTSPVGWELISIDPIALTPAAAPVLCATPATRSASHAIDGSSETPRRTC